MGFFSNIFKSKEKKLKAQKYKIGMSKTRDSVFSNLEDILKSSGKINDALFDQIEEVFIMADVGVNTTIQFVNHLRKTVNVKKIEDVDHLMEVIIEEIYSLYSKDDEMSHALDIKEGRLNVVLFVGVNGVGKTTTIAKVANEYVQSGKKVLMVAGDTFRAGAINQLGIWAERVGSDFFKKEEGSDPSSVMFDAITYAKENGIDLMLCDTAGRLQNKKNLMAELDKINRVIGREIGDAPHETLLVIDATTGQNGLSQAKIFNEVTRISGVVLTKLDGTAKGGIVLAINEEMGIPIKYVGLGEKLDDLEHFDFAEYLYGMFGDVL
jgi:fused signal recognition particle receptor